MTTRDPLQKEMATEKKEERIHEAERQKQEARGHDIATRQAAAAGGTFGHDYTTGGGQPTTGPGYVEARQDYPQGLVGRGSEHPEGVGPEDPNVAGGRRTGYGPGKTT